MNLLIIDLLKVNRRKERTEIVASLFITNDKIDIFFSLVVKFYFEFTSAELILANGDLVSRRVVDLSILRQIQIIVVVHETSIELV